MNAKYLLTCLVLIWSFSKLAAQNEQLSVDEIVQKHITAVGGLERLQSVQSIKITGKYSFRGLEYPYTLLRMRPHFFRFELNVDGKQLIVGFDGEIIWELNELRSSEAGEVRDPFTRNFVDISADFDGALIGYKAKENLVELVGMENVDNQETYNLKITQKNGKIENWFIHRDSFHLIKRARVIALPELEFNHAMIFMDYEPVQGLMIPHYIERLDAHYVRGYEVTNVELNPNIDKQIFTMPKSITEN